MACLHLPQNSHKPWWTYHIMLLKIMIQSLFCTVICEWPQVMYSTCSGLSRSNRYPWGTDIGPISLRSPITPLKLIFKRTMGLKFLSNICIGNVLPNAVFFPHGNRFACCLLSLAVAFLRLVQTAIVKPCLVGHKRLDWFWTHLPSGLGACFANAL